MHLLAILGLLASMATAAQPELAITIIYDNTSARPGITADWGFSALVTFRGHRVLFDAGAKPDVFLGNLNKLNIDPATIEHVVVSHAHGDHLGGVYALYLKNRTMTVHFLDSFPPQAFEKAAEIGMKPRRVTGPFEVAPGIYSTGIIDGSPPEQSLVVQTSKGLVLLTGCSHPGVVKIVEAAEQQRQANSVRLLLGGFHMVQQDAATVRATIFRLKKLNVTAVLPAHCTGDLASRLFREAYGEQCSAAGAGKLIVLD